MADANQVGVGRINLSSGVGYDGAGDKYATYLKLFSGEMFKGFQHNTIARDLVTKRTLKNGKSLQFIYTGRMTSDYHTPGTPILGNADKAPPVAEKTIVMDDLLVSSAFVYDLDETLSHYDLRGEISRKIGYALAENYDRKIFRAIAKGARQASPISATGFVEPGGTQIQLNGTQNNTQATTASNLVTGFYDAASVLDEKGVSSDGRVAVLNPRQYYALIQQTGDNGLINRDVQGTGLQSGEGVVSIAGIKIYKSMNLPFLGKFGTANTISNAGSFIGQSMDSGSGRQTATYARSGTTITVTLNAHGLSVGDKVVFDATAGGGTSGTYTVATVATNTFTITDTVSGTVSGGTACAFNIAGVNNGYGEAGDFAGSCGLIFQKEAAGVVEAIGPQVQVTNGDISVIYQGDVILGRMAMGADYLNPAACVELHVGTADAAF
ncbi:minor capsid protein 10 [uncultured phage MedDCM-OCT-S08-C304]|nr:minor capsid protein 10 [uncultured phage MedDCM-OCT-S08-C304]